MIAYVLNLEYNKHESDCVSLYLSLNMTLYVVEVGMEGADY